MADIIRTHAELVDAVDQAADGDTVTVQSFEGLGADLADGVNLVKTADAKGLKLQALEGLAACEDEDRSKSGLTLMTHLALIIGEQYGHASPEDVERLRAEVVDLRAQLDIKNQAAA